MPEGSRPSLDELFDKAGLTGETTGAGSDQPAGSTPQLKAAIGTPTSVTVNPQVHEPPGGAPAAPGPSGTGVTLREQTPGPVTATPSSSAGIEKFPEMFHAVLMVESGGHHIDPKTGTVMISPKGAVGIAQIEPEDHPGVNVYDERENLAAGEKELRADFAKYGNWDDALIAYNWGQGNLDAYKKTGRGIHGQPMPQETKNYVPAVEKQLGLSPGLLFVGDRDKTAALDAILDRANKDTGASPGTTDDLRDEALIGGLIGVDKGQIDAGREGADQIEALMSGGVQGYRNLALGPIQTALQNFAPQEWHDEFTKAINAMDQPFQRQSQEHPYAHFAGEVIGTTLGLLTATKIASSIELPSMMTRYMQMATNRLPAMLKAMGIGGFLGGTSYNADPENSNRIGQTIIGISLGAIGHTVAQSITDAFQFVSDRAAIQSFMENLKQNYADLEPSMSKVRDILTGNFKRRMTTRDAKYISRSQAGAPLEGYPSGYAQGGAVEGSIAQTLEDAAAGKIGFDEKSGLVSSTARKVQRDLGLDEQQARLNEWQAKQKQFEQEMRDWQNGKGFPNVAGTPLEKMTPQSRAIFVRQAHEQGLGPAMPVAPEPFEAEPIPASRMAEARRTIERDKRKATSSAQQTQLNLLKQNLDRVAAQQAREAGLDIAGYERAQAAADKYNKENIKPLAEFFGSKKRPMSLADAKELDKADVYNKVLDVIKGKTKDNREAQKRLHDILGPRGREETRKIIFNDMLSNARTSQHLADYIQKHRIGIEEILGREEAGKLAGLAKVAENMVSEARAQGMFKMVGHHSWLLGFAGVHMAEGEMHSAARLAKAAVYVEVAKAGMRMIQKIPRAMAIVARAEKASPAQMKVMMNQLDQVMSVYSKAQSRVIPQESGGADVGDVAGAGLDVAKEVPSMVYQWATQ